MFTNHYFDNNMQLQLLDVETTNIWEVKYKHPLCWTYAHHPFITVFNNQLYAIWSNGKIHEDEPGQRILIAESSDFHTWKNHAICLATSSKDLAFTAAGFHQYMEQIYFQQ